MIQFALMAAKSVMSFMGSRAQAKAVQKQAEYEAAVIRANGQQAMYDAQTRATVAEFNRQREVQDNATEEADVSRKYRSAGRDTRISYITRGIDPSAAFNALATDKERTFQEIGFKTSKVQANLDSEGRLAKFYGSLALRNSEIEATNTVNAGILKSKSIKRMAVVNALSDAASMWGDYGSSISSSFKSMFGPSTPTPVSNNLSFQTGSSNPTFGVSNQRAGDF